MTAATISSLSDIEDLERSGNRYEATADWYGEEVDVVVDARVGVVLEPKEMERSQIRVKLQDEGWEEVEVERDGGSFQAVAERDGTEYRLYIDSISGTVLDQQERDS